MPRRRFRRVFSRTRCLTSATRLAVSYISFEPPFRFVWKCDKNPFTYIGTKNRKNSHPKRKIFQKNLRAAKKQLSRRGCPHSGNAEQEKAELPPAHAQGGHQQWRYHADEDVFNIGHASTAFLVADSSPKMASVSSISHQKVGLSGEVFGQKQPNVQSRYSANTKYSTPM